MDFAWTDDRLELRRTAADFARRRLVSGALERDRSGEFSRDLWDACAEFGLQGLRVPQELGGSGHDLLDAVAILEGIGSEARDHGLVFSVVAHAASCEGPLAAFGSDEQKAGWLPGLADGSIVGATGITEPDSGSDALSMATTAQRDGDDWILDGAKTFVTNAPIADLFVVYARTGASAFAGITAFLVPRDAPGLEVGPPMSKMGLRTSPMGQVFFDGCRVPASSVLGSPGSGALVFHGTMDVERILVMAPAIGTMERILETTVAHARERRAGKKSLGEHQAISHRIADIELDLESARLLLYRAAWRRSHHGSSVRESALAKLATSEAYVRTCRSALQIFGGYGYVVETGIEKELRDALATTLYVGTSEIQRNLVAGLRGLG